MARWALWLVAALAFYALIPHPAYFDARYGVTQLYDGTAHNPFARRALAPALIRAGVALVPAPIRSRIDARVAPIARERGGRAEHGTVIAVSALLTVASMTVFFALLAQGLTALGVTMPAAAGASILVLPLLHVFTNFSVFAYDHLVLALFAAATLRLWLRGPADRGFDGLVLVAAFAKETALLLPLAALATEPRLGREGLWRFARRTAVVTLVQGALLWSVAGRPGEVVELHLRENLAIATQLSSWFATEAFEKTVFLPRGLAWPRPVGFHLGVWGPIVALAVVGAGRERSLGRATLAMALPLAALQFSFGVFNEVRNFYEVFPSLVWLSAAGMCRLLGRPTRPRSAAGSA
jgi:hypothetical protein